MSCVQLQGAPAPLAFRPADRSSELKLTEKPMKWQDLHETLLSKQPPQETDTLHCCGCLIYFPTAVPLQGHHGSVFLPGTAEFTHL